MKQWHEATTHVMSHALHYGSSVFEGIRVYDTPDGPMAFRLAEHLERLLYSARVYRMPVEVDTVELMNICRQVVAANELESAYLRPVLYRGFGGLGVAASADTPVELAVAAIPWGAYLGEEGLEQGVDVCVSSWQRVAPNTIPAGAKAGGNYLSSQLISMEAKRLGFAEGIGLGSDGLVSEGAGENLFLVRDGVIHTPPAAASILGGLTRNSVIRLAEDLGYRVIEQALPREMLYLADELFFTGTAAEITPIRSVDGLKIGSGSRGPMTAALQQRFFGLFDGRTEDRHGWLTPMAMTEEVAHDAPAVAV
jgi:branched-chain amino acid aminotransferase